MFENLFRGLGIGDLNSGACCGDGVECAGDAEIHSTNPATGRPLPSVRMASVADYERVVTRASEVFKTWRLVPPPRRGEVVRQIGAALRRASPTWACW